MKLHQIYDDDLAELERTLPQFYERLMPHLDNRLRAQVRRVQKILTDVRWNYGPHGEVEVVPVDEP